MAAVDTEMEVEDVAEMEEGAEAEAVMVVDKFGCL